MDPLAVLLALVALGWSAGFLARSVVLGAAAAMLLMSDVSLLRQAHFVLAESWFAAFVALHAAAALYTVRRRGLGGLALASAFAASETDVLGVSADPVKAQEKFRDKHQLTVPLMSDEKHEMLEAYGAWGQKSMYGKSFMGIVRMTVLIGPNGKIAQIWPKVRVDGHADEVLAAAKAL